MSTEEDPYSNEDNFLFAGLFYCNADDERTMIKVPGTANRYRLNYARWQTYLILVIFWGIVAYAFLSSRH